MVYDRERRLVRRGSIALENAETPYCLLETRQSAAGGGGPTGRGDWSLAIGVSTYGQFVDGRPLKLATGTVVTNDGGARFNFIHPRRIHWTGPAAPQGDGTGSTPARDETDDEAVLEARWVEPKEPGLPYPADATTGGN
jgi:hypothetical protein